MHSRQQRAFSFASRWWNLASKTSMKSSRCGLLGAGFDFFASRGPPSRSKRVIGEYQFRRFVFRFERKLGDYTNDDSTHTRSSRWKARYMPAEARSFHRGSFFNPTLETLNPSAR